MSILYRHKKNSNKKLIERCNIEYNFKLGNDNDNDAAVKWVANFIYAPINCAFMFCLLNFTTGITIYNVHQVFSVFIILIFFLSSKFSICASARTPWLATKMCVIFWTWTSESTVFIVYIFWSILFVYHIKLHLHTFAIASIISYTCNFQLIVNRSWIYNTKSCPNKRSGVSSFFPYSLLHHSRCSCAQVSIVQSHLSPRLYLC